MELQTYNFEGHEVRVIIAKKGRRWIAGDVCASLDMKRTWNIKGADKEFHSVKTIGGIQQMLIISEAALGRLLIRSSKPAAQRFYNYFSINAAAQLINQTETTFRRENQFEPVVEEFEPRICEQMQALPPFFFENHEVRIAMRGDEAWFNASDLCGILGLKNTTKAMLPLDSEYTTLISIQGKGRNRDTNFVNEFGMYQLIMGSCKPQAKRFKKWVFEKVLPSIRKNGMYVVHDYDFEPEPDTEMQMARKYVRALERNEEEQLKNRQLQSVNEHQEAEIKCLEAKNEDMKPMADLAEDWSNYIGFVDTSEVVKELLGFPHPSAQKLHLFLNDLGVIWKPEEGKPWILRVDYTHEKEEDWLGRMKWVDKPNIRKFWKKHLMWTPRGQKLIHDLWNNHDSPKEIKRILKEARSSRSLKN